MYKADSAASITYKNPFHVGIKEIAGKDDFTVQSPRRYASLSLCENERKKAERRGCSTDSWKYSRFPFSCSFFILQFKLPIRCCTRKRRKEWKEENALKVISVSMDLKTTTFYILQCFVRYMELAQCVTLLGFHCRLRQWKSRARARCYFDVIK